MKKTIAKTVIAACLATAMCAALAACTTQPEDGKEEEKPPVTPTGIQTPTEFSIADNAYSFKGVDNASYYQMYFYTSATATEHDYALPSIIASASKTTYSGTITTVPAGSYTVKLFAYDADDEASAPAVITASITAELSAPTIEYWYDATLGKLDLQLENFDVYQNESTPEVKVTLTDLAGGDPAVKSFTVEAITAAFDMISGERSDYPYIEFDVEEGHSYSLKAQAVAKSEHASSSDEVTAFASIELGKVNKKSAGFDAVWSSNVCADSIAELDVTVTDEILLSSENSTISEIADGALMNFRYRQANDSGRKTGFKRDFGYEIKITKDATAQDGCTHSYTLTYAQGPNTGTGHLYLKADGTAELHLDPPASGVPVGGTFGGGWLYTDADETKVAVNISNNNLVSKFSDAT